MPTYEFRCHDCGNTFEVKRSMSQSGDPANCPAGHADTVRLLSTVALTGSGSGSPMGSASTAAPAGMGGGGCCGGGCCG